MKKLLFITGTRADYGKIKPLLKKVEKSEDFELSIFVTGMHIIEKYGSTYKEILKDNYKNVYIAFGLSNLDSMSYNLGDVVCHLTNYIKNNKPDLIIIHGDRIDALAGAIVGSLNNILVAHIEGGELSGTIDDSIRHSISKLSHIHLACNLNAKQRLLQLGEEENRIHIIGSPDVDIMRGNDLPSLESTKKRYDINFRKYAILIYHPVTTEEIFINKKIKQVIDATILSRLNYIVIYPNNDNGSSIIINEYTAQFSNSKKIKLFPSIGFEYFLTLLKNAHFILGNSSAGIRESGIYGVPSIDIGTRQSGRYTTSSNSNIQHVTENSDKIINAIKRVQNYRKINFEFGNGNSSTKFMNLIESDNIWTINIQKKFIDFVEPVVQNFSTANILKLNNCI